MGFLLWAWFCGCLSNILKEKKPKIHLYGLKWPNPKQKQFKDFAITTLTIEIFFIFLPNHIFCVKYIYLV